MSEMPRTWWDGTEGAAKIADRWAKEHPSTMCFVGGRLEFHLTEEEFVGLVRDVLAVRSAGDGTADVERRPWSANPGEPICNRMYSGEYWVAKTCIQALGHGGGHADWYGRTWCKDERDSAGDGATDVRVEWGADLRDTEDPGPRVCGGEWSARVLAEREPENRLLRRTVTTSEWEVVDR